MKFDLQNFKTKEYVHYFNITDVKLAGSAHNLIPGNKADA